MIRLPKPSEQNNSCLQLAPNTATMALTNQNIRQPRKGGDEEFMNEG